MNGAHGRTTADAITALLRTCPTADAAPEDVDRWLAEKEESCSPPSVAASRPRRTSDRGCRAPALRASVIRQPVEVVRRVSTRRRCHRVAEYRQHLGSVDESERSGKFTPTVGVARCPRG